MEGNLRLRIFSSEINFRDAYMIMLLHLNEDFDDDLVQDAIGLLYE